MKTKNLLNILFAAVFLCAILGCKAISDLGGSKSSDNTSSTPVSTSTPAPTATPNKLVGTWTGKSADGSNNLEMVFTNDEWTLSSNGSPVRGTQKYKFTDSETIEVTTGDGSKFPMKVVVTGDTLNVDMRGTKVVMKRKS